MEKWLRRAEELYLEYQTIQVKKDFEADRTIIIETIEDIKQDMSNVQSLTISSLYSGPDILEYLSEILENSPNLVELSIFCRGVSWKDISHLELRKIKKLSVNIEGFELNETISAMRLRELYIFMTSSSDLSLIEKKIAPIISIDFSQMSLIEKLTLKNFCRLDPRCLSSLQQLTKLHITGTDIIDLHWLSEMSFRLEEFYFYGELMSCEGIESQQELKKVSLSGNSLQEIEPIKTLRNLAYLDLSRNNIFNESGIRELGISELVINGEDEDLYRIKKRIDLILNSSVRRIILDNQKYFEMDDLAPAIQKAWMRKFFTPFKKRLITEIGYEYSKTLQQLVKSEYRLGKALSGEEYIQTFNKLTISYFPFLDIKNINNI